MKKIALIIPILLAALMVASLTTFSANGEKDALIALYNSTNGAGWTNKWDTTTDHCTWYGVSCDGSGNVLLLDLSYNKLDGPIPPELGNLSNLLDLHLHYNMLSGSIPAELGNLSSLSQLYLYNNQLSGSIPPELGNLSNLGVLGLHNNQLSGPIPAELSNLTNLWLLGMDGNPALVCWETQAALDWAMGLSSGSGYNGPGVVCQFVHLPLVTR